MPSTASKGLHTETNTPATHSSFRPGSNQASGIAHFQRGVSVRILGTENVLQRCPHLVGSVGTIREVPVHPTTWFKIEFPGGNVMTFRPSAFKLAGDGADDDDTAYIVPQKKSARCPAVFAPPSAAMASYYGAEGHDGDGDELTVGALVRILDGRHAGATGEVVRLGNGWVQVLTEHGEVSKRSQELEALPGGARGVSWRPAPRAADDDTKRSKSGRAIRARASNAFSPSSAQGPSGRHRPHHAAQHAPRVQTTFVFTSNEEGQVRVWPAWKHLQK